MGTTFESVYTQTVEFLKSDDFRIENQGIDKGIYLTQEDVDNVINEAYVIAQSNLNEAAMTRAVNESLDIIDENHYLIAATRYIELTLTDESRQFCSLCVWDTNNLIN